MKYLLTLGAIALSCSLIGQEVNSNIARHYGPEARPVTLLGSDQAIESAGKSTDGTWVRTLDFAPLTAVAEPGQPTLIPINAGVTLNRAIAALAESAGLGYVPSPLITENITDSLRIPKDSAIVMINHLIAPYGYRAIVQNHVVQVFGGAINAKMAPAVLTYKLKHVNFAQIATAPTSQTALAQTGGQTGSGQSQDQSQNSSQGQGGSSASQVLAPRDLAAKNVSDFFKRLGKLILSGDSAQIDYDAKTRTVVARDLPPYLEMLRQYLDQLDVPQKKVVIEFKMMSISHTPERNEGVDWSSFLGNVKGTLKDTSGSSDASSSAVSDAAGSVLSSAGINFKGFNSPGRKNLTLSLPELSATLNLIRKYADVDVVQETTLEANDGMPAHNFVGQQLFIVVPGTTASGAGTSSQPLTFQPLIGDTVTVVPEVNPFDISMAFTLSSSREAANRSYGGNDYPQFDMRRTDEYITVPEGKTAVLAAYKSDSTSVERNDIPLLGDIPFIGPRLFGSTKSSRHRTVVLFLLTPRVVRADDAESLELLSQNLVKNLRDDPTKINAYIPPEQGLRSPISGVSESKHQQKKDPNANERILSSPIEAPAVQAPTAPAPSVTPAAAVPIPASTEQTTVSLLRTEK